MQFSVTQLLLDNAYEFPITPEWGRLLYEEFYTQWLSDELDMTDPVIYVEAKYQAFLTKFNKAVIKLTPVFNCKNIELLPGGTYRVTVQVEGSRVRQTFDTLDAARLFRNEMLDHSKVEGFMSRPYAAAS